MSATNYLGSSTAVAMNALLAQTMQKIEEKNVVQDAITGANQFFHYLKTNGRIRRAADGGERLQVNLMYGHNSTFGSYKGYDVLPNDPQDGVTVAYAPWAQYAITISESGLTLLQNAGKEKIKDMIATKIEQSTMTIAEEFNTHLWDATNTGTTTGNGGKNIQSIPMLVDYDADRDRAIQGINALTRTWWRNQTLDYGATHSLNVFKRKLLNMYMTCAGENFGGEPDLCVMGPDAYENYEMSIEPQRRYTTSGKQTAGYEDLMYKRAKVIWDAKVPNAEADGANTTDDSIYFLNSKFIGLWVLGGRDWKWGPWEKPVQQDAKQCTALWAGQLAVTNRRKHGVIYGVTKGAYTS